MGNIPMDFTDDNIPSVYDEGIIVGNKIIKKKQKKIITWRFYQRNYNEIYSIGKIRRQNRW